MTAIRSERLNWSLSDGKSGLILQHKCWRLPSRQRKLWRMHRLIMVLAILLCPLTASAQNWFEPARGTGLSWAFIEIRAAPRRMNWWSANRICSWRSLGLRVMSPFVSPNYTTSWRKNRSTCAPTPGYARGVVDTSRVSVPQSIQVLYRRSGNTWVAQHMQLSALSDTYNNFGRAAALHISNSSVQA
jgi:hypothetical protein